MYQHDVTTKGLRARNTALLRRQIADRALDLFETAGYELTSLEAIARAADISVSTLHRHFPTKESLLVEHPLLQRNGLAEAFATVRSAPLASALETSVLVYLGAADTGRLFLRRLRDCVDHVPAAQARIGDFWRREGLALLAAVASHPEAQDDPVAAELLCGSAVFVVILALRHARLHRERSARAIGEELLSTDRLLRSRSSVAAPLAAN